MTEPATTTETDGQQQEAARRARAMYRRVLVGWATDALTLRAAGLDRPCHRRAFGAVSPLRIRRTGPEAWVRRVA